MRNPRRVIVDELGRIRKESKMEAIERITSDHLKKAEVLNASESSKFHIAEKRVEFQRTLFERRNMQIVNKYKQNLQQHQALKALLKEAALQEVQDHEKECPHQHKTDPRQILAWENYRSSPFSLSQMSNSRVKIDEYSKSRTTGLDRPKLHKLIEEGICHISSTSKRRRAAKRMLQELKPMEVFDRRLSFNALLKHVRNLYNIKQNEAIFLSVLMKQYTMKRLLFKPNILLSFNDIGKRPPVFADAAVVADAIIELGYKYDVAKLFYNRFKTIVSYKTTELPLFNLEAINSAEKLHLYDSLDDEVIRSYNEFALVSQLFHAMKEAAATEQSQRMTAMDGATKNAGEMIDKLRMSFNRTRQAVITRELIEIISGAAAL